MNRTRNSAATSTPANLWWGVAQAGHQNDGGDRNSDTTFIENLHPTPFREPAGEACRAWELWPGDLDLAAGMGLNAFRFSIEWARVEPEKGVLDATSLARYDALVDGCLERGMTPLATFSHFTAPHWFAKAGSWMSETAADEFAAYSALLTERFGDRLGAVVTLNEPNLAQVLYSGALPVELWDINRAALAAASAQTGVPRYRAGNVMVPEEFEEFEEGLTRAHIAARAAIRSVRADLPVGLSIAIADDVAVSGGEESRDERRRACYDHWLDLARADDFIGIQNYERRLHGPDGILPPREGAVVNDMGSEVAPGALAGAARYAYARSGVPVLVTEHGVATADDAIRAAFIGPAIDELMAVVAEEGIEFLGYCHWTLMDNFEWVFGYDMQLGLHEVDRGTFERRAKPSAGALRDAVARHRRESVAS